MIFLRFPEYALTLSSQSEIMKTNFDFSFEGGFHSCKQKLITRSVKLEKESPAFQRPVPSSKLLSMAIML